jgi:hypothetical protein
MELRVARPGRDRDGARLEVWLDRPAGGRRVATCELPRTRGVEDWKTIRCPLRAAGTHDVYLQVRGGRGEVLRLASLHFVAR